MYRYLSLTILESCVQLTMFFFHLLKPFSIVFENWLRISFKFVGLSTAIYLPLDFLCWNDTCLSWRNNNGKWNWFNLKHSANNSANRDMLSNHTSPRSHSLLFFMSLFLFRGFIDYFIYFNFIMFGKSTVYIKLK